jgi:hypothetical protein
MYLLIPLGLIRIQPNETSNSGIPTPAIVNQIASRILPLASQLDVAIQSRSNSLPNINRLVQATMRVVGKQLLGSLTLAIVNKNLSATFDPRLDLSETLVLEPDKHVRDDRVVLLGIGAHEVEDSLEDAEDELAGFLVLVVGVQELARCLVVEVSMLAGLGRDRLYADPPGCERRCDCSCGSYPQAEHVGVYAIAEGEHLAVSRLVVFVGC